MGFLLAATVQHHNVGNGKAVAGEVGGTVKVECTVDVLQRGFAVQRGRVDKIVILPVNGQPRFLQALVSLKAIVPCFRPAFELVDGKGVALFRGIDGEMRVTSFNTSFSECRYRNGLYFMLLEKLMVFSTFTR